MSSLTPPALSDITFDHFRDQWLAEVIDGSTSTVELGNRFARKLLVQWLDLDESTGDLIYCDGSGDGGIDAAYLDRGTEEQTEEAAQGHTWYLVQSKYGSAFQGTGTLLRESQKLIDTLDGKHGRLSSLAEGLLDSLMNFRRQASERDKIVLVFATVDPLNEEQQRALNDVRAMGRARLGSGFDAEACSVHTLFQRTLEEPLKQGERLRIPVKGSLTGSGPGLLVGSISLFDLYAFLKAYRALTQDLDQLYRRMSAASWAVGGRSTKVFRRRSLSIRRSSGCTTTASRLLLKTSCEQARASTRSWSHSSSTAVRPHAVFGTCSIVDSILEALAPTRHLRTGKGGRATAWSLRRLLASVETARRYWRRSRATPIARTP
jgi:hypothetical protein